jgi:hypothetical protein
MIKNPALHEAHRCLAVTSSNSPHNRRMTAVVVRLQLSATIATAACQDTLRLMPPMRLVARMTYVFGSCNNRPCRYHHRARTLSIGIVLLESSHRLRLGVPKSRCNRSKISGNLGPLP